MVIILVLLLPPMAQGEVLLILYLRWHDILLKDAMEFPQETMLFIISRTKGNSHFKLDVYESVDFYGTIEHNRK